MMDKSTYDAINKYCTSKYNGFLVQAEKDYILRKFLDSYYESLKKFAETNGTEADEQQKKTIANTSPFHIFSSLALLRSSPRSKSSSIGVQEEDLVFIYIFIGLCVLLPLQAYLKLHGIRAHRYTYSLSHNYPREDIFAAPL